MVTRRVFLKSAGAAVALDLSHAVRRCCTGEGRLMGHALAAVVTV